MSWDGVQASVVFGSSRRTGRGMGMGHPPPRHLQISPACLPPRVPRPNPGLPPAGLIIAVRMNGEPLLGQLRSIRIGIVLMDARTYSTITVRCLTIGNGLQRTPPHPPAPLLLPPQVRSQDRTSSSRDSNRSLAVAERAIPTRRGRLVGVRGIDRQGTSPQGRRTWDSSTPSGRSSVASTM